MSLKAVEMQVALPRTTNAGQVQNQLVQKPVSDQEQLTQQQLKQLEVERKKSTKLKWESRINHQKDSSGHSSSYQPTARKKKQTDSEDETNLPQHPYKGKHIDFLL